MSAKHTPTPTPKPTGGKWFVQPFKGDDVHNLSICSTQKPGYLALAQMTGCHVDTPANAAFIVTACNQHAQLVAQNERLRAALADAEAYFDNHADVVDGDYGEPAPNKAMTVLTVIRTALSQPEKQS